MDDELNKCSIMLKTTRQNELGVLDVEITQRYKFTPQIPDVNDTILTRPSIHDMMFFILGKKTAKEKFMFLCHLGEPRDPENPNGSKGKV